MLTVGNMVICDKGLLAIRFDGPGTRYFLVEVTIDGFIEYFRYTDYKDCCEWGWQPMNAIQFPRCHRDALQYLIRETQGDVFAAAF